MEERFPDEFVTWRHKTFIGVKVDEVYGMDSRSGKTWIELARQIYSEQGDLDYKVLEHYPNGAPYLEGYNGRISVTHCSHFFAVAGLPKTPEVNLEFYNPRAAMGIDAERLDRSQVLKIRDKFLSSEEKEFIKEDDLQANILAWTAKEAAYKAAFQQGIDFCNDIRIIKLPRLQKDPLKGKLEELGELNLSCSKESDLGVLEFKLFSYESYGCCVTIAYSPKCAKFGRQ